MHDNLLCGTGHYAADRETAGKAMRDRRRITYAG
jgi:hypothetical protein